MIERLILGDNQFFGVNHMSEERARVQAARFQRTEAIIQVLETAYSEGVRTFMCTTHERIAEVCDFFRANKARYPDFQLYPCMPYAHKYANAATDLGVLGALRSFLPDESPLAAALKGGLSIARKDIGSLAGMLIDAEMKMFRDLPTPAIFLQNVMTDFLLGMGFDEALRVFADHVRKRYNAEPGYITMNLPMLLPRLEKLGVRNPLICANVNKLEFRMCGGRRTYEELIAQGRCRTIAMSVFASGALPAEEALEYVCEQSGIDSIVFGASSRAHIAQTRDLVTRLTRPRAAALTS
jgi:hypothetical protein